MACEEGIQLALSEERLRDEEEKREARHGKLIYQQLWHLHCIQDRWLAKASTVAGTSATALPR